MDISKDPHQRGSYCANPRRKAPRSCKPWDAFQRALRGLLQATQRVPSNVKSAAHTTTHAPEPGGRAKSDTPLRAEGSTPCRLPVGRLAPSHHSSSQVRTAVRAHADARTNAYRAR